MAGRRVAVGAFSARAFLPFPKIAAGRTERQAKTKRRVNFSISSSFIQRTFF
jgi:hypothetical protein